MSDAVDRLAQALRDLINEAVQAAVERERPTPPPERVVERPKVPDEEFDRCPWCNKKHKRHHMPVTEARQQLGGISPLNPRVFGLSFRRTKNCVDGDK